MEQAEFERQMALAQSQQSSGGGMVMMVIQLAVLGLIVASMWKVFTKAGHPGWAAIVPIYNVIILHKIAGKPTWWILLYLVPVVGFVISLLVTLSVANHFGKSAGFGIGLWLLSPIFYPMLAFGDAQYQGAKA